MLKVVHIQTDVLYDFSCPPTEEKTLTALIVFHGLRIKLYLFKLPLSQRCSQQAKEGLFLFWRFHLYHNAFWKVEKKKTKPTRM